MYVSCVASLSAIPVRPLQARSSALRGGQLQAVLDHAEREEREEFPPVRARESRSTLAGMGALLRAAEKTAPTHPHPSTAGSPIAQWMAGPWAAAIDRARDAIKAAMPRS